MSVTASCILLTAVGCNQFFDLEPTSNTDEMADVDSDGVPDNTDNCPTIANDQANADGDPFGDACDACPMVASASTHDEDRDTVGDECDLCPGIEDLGADFDHDGVGDICDPDRTDMQTHRLAFEPFVVMPAGWQMGATAWAQSDDSIAPVSDLASTDTGLRTSITTSGGAWATVAGFYARTRWQSSDRFGLAAIGPTKTLSCLVTCSPAEIGCFAETWINGQASMPYTVAPRPAMRVAILVRSPGAAACLFEGFNSNNPQFVAIGTTGMTIAVVASPRIHATYFEHLQ